MDFLSDLMMGIVTVGQWSDLKWVHLSELKKDPRLDSQSDLLRDLQWEPLMDDPLDSRSAPMSDRQTDMWWAQKWG